MLCRTNSRVACYAIYALVGVSSPERGTLGVSRKKDANLRKHSILHKQAASDALFIASPYKNLQGRYNLLRRPFQQKCVIASSGCSRFAVTDS